MDVSLLPHWYQYSFVFVLGLIIGSFLNVVIYRFNTGKSLNGHSHCLSCGTSLTWYELVPLVSYLYLRGRCRSCSSYIPARYLFCELLTGVLFLLAFIQLPFGWLLLLTLVMLTLLVVIFFYDVYHLIIPDGLVIAVSVVALVMMAFSTSDWFEALLHLFGALGAAVFFAGLWLISRGRWIGLGDAKLAFPLALTVGPVGAFSFVILSFWIGSVVGLTLLGGVWLLKRGQRYLPRRQIRFTMKSEVPFAPFIIASWLLVFLYQLDIMNIVEAVLFSL
jgi:prepilin signal peptidase PulO-like enzyme (type II secretory pathway)